jgi:hypothetical protein
MGGGGGGDDFNADMAELNSVDEIGDETDEEVVEEEESVQEEEEEPVVKAKDEEIEEEEEDEEEEEVEEKAEEEEDEEEKEKEPERIEGKPTVSQLKKAYPDIFKRFPYLRDMYFSHEKFSQHIADPEMVPELIEKSSNFDRLESSLMTGDPGLLLDEIKEGNPEAFKKVASNFLPTLRKMDQNLYIDLTLPILQEAIYHMVEYGKSRGEAGKNYVRSAEWTADFLFGKPEIPDLSKRMNGQEKHPAEIQLEKEREARQREEFTRATSDVNSSIDKSLEAMVRDGLDDSLTPFVKSAVIDKTLGEFINSLKGDKAFQVRINGLWKTARAANFSEASKKQIVEAYTARARQTIRSLRARFVQEAGGRNKATLKKGNISAKTDKSEEKREEQREDREKPRKRNFDSHGRSGKTGSGRESVLDSSKIDYSRTSDEDILSGDRSRIKLKGR